MATTVVSVVIFLCGVLVGRGVRAQQILGDEPTTDPAAGSRARVDRHASLMPVRRLREPPSPPAESSDPALTDKTPAAATRQAARRNAAPPPAETTPPSSRSARSRSARSRRGRHRRQLPTSAPTPAPRPHRRRRQRTARGRAELVARPVGRPDRCPSRSRGGQLHRGAPERQGVSSVHRQPDGGHARACVQGAGRALRRSRRGRAGRAAPRKRRTVQALGFTLALLSGVLLALSFPKFGHPACAWVALDAPCCRRRPCTDRGHRVPRAPLWTAPSCSACLRRCLLRRNALLAGRDDDDVRRAVDGAGGVRRAAPRCLSGALSGRVRRHPRAAGPGARASGDPACAARSGWRRSWAGSMSGTGFPGRSSATARSPFFPSRRLASVLGVYGLSALLALDLRGGGVCDLMRAVAAGGCRLAARRSWCRDCRLGAARGSQRSDCSRPATRCASPSSRGTSRRRTSGIRRCATRSPIAICR